MAEFVESMKSSKKVVVFSKSTCPYCAKAKQILNEALNDLNLSEDIEIIEVNLRNDASDVQAYLLKLTGGRSLPRVFINGEFIGGCDDTQALQNSGNLKKTITG